MLRKTLNRTLKLNRAFNETLHLKMMLSFTKFDVQITNLPCCFICDTKIFATAGPYADFLKGVLLL